MSVAEAGNDPERYLNDRRRTMPVYLIDDTDLAGTIPYLPKAT